MNEKRQNQHADIELTGSEQGRPGLVVEADDDADIGQLFGAGQIGLQVIVNTAPITSPVR